MIRYVPKVENRRDLDLWVKDVYDTYSHCGQHYSRSGYRSLIQGGANALHRFGEIIVPRTNDGQVHVIEVREAIAAFTAGGR